MPSGKVHSALTLATASGVLAPYVIVQFGGDPWAYVAGCLTGIMIMPDMDVDAGNISDQMIRRVFPPAQWFWRAFWFPYAKLVPHRHNISHFPILGTVLRIGYVFLVVNLINLLGRSILSLFDTVSLIWIWDWWFFLGLVHVDTIHWITDNTIKGKEVFEDG